MQKRVLTFFDYVNTRKEPTDLLRDIAKMLAMQNRDYADAFAADELRSAIAMEMLEFAHKTKGQNYEVTCTYQGITESSTFRAIELFSITELVHDIMGLQDYVDKVVTPISQELAARIISKIEGPLSETSCDIKVGLA